MVVSVQEESAVARRREVRDQTQRELLGCIAAEAEAEREVQAAEREISEATRTASDPNGPDETVEAFARWLPGARQRLEWAKCRLERLQAETARVRASLAACRV